MIQQNIQPTELKEIVRQLFLEVLAEEKSKLAELFMPDVSRSEQLEIEKVYGNPAKFDNNDFVDVTAWFAL